MAKIVVGCDKNNSADKKWRDTVVRYLKKDGHDVEKLDIAPGPFASYSYKSKAKGKIGVYLMAGSLVSFLDGAKSNFKYCYFGIRSDASRTFKTKSAFNSKGVPKDHHGDCPSSLCDKWAGKTYPQLNNAFKSRAKALFGANPEQLAKDIAREIGGTGSSSGGDGSDSSSESDGSGGSNVKDCIQNLLKHWDGDVECYIRGDEIHINKVRNPEKYYSCMLKEDVNVILDSITVTDVNPDTPNHLIVEWTGGKIEFRDEKAIVRFGEKPKTVQAVRKVVKTVEKPVKTETSTDTESDTSETSESTS